MLTLSSSDRPTPRVLGSAGRDVDGRAGSEMCRPSWLRLVASGFLASLMAACASGPPPPTATERDLAKYRTLSNYRALAVTGASLSTEHYVYAWSLGADSIDGAAKEAIRLCASHQATTTLPACELYAIGNIVVAKASPAERELADCIYILNPSAKSLDDPFAPLCESAKTIRLTLPSTSAAPVGGTVLMSEFVSSDDGSRGQAVPADLSGSADPSAPGAVLLTAEAVRDQLAGNTLAVAGSSYIYLKPDGTAVLRTAGPSVGPGLGHWRVNADGYYCARWPKVDRGYETCRPIVPKGNAYEIGDLSVTVIKGNAFGL